MSKLKAVSILLLAGALAACDGSPVIGSSISDAVGTAASNIARDINAERAGRHLGFDTYTYPGEESMRAWKQAEKPYQWVGYYLEAPCHIDASWSGKRQTLTNMGWGLAVIYVGQQTWGRTPGQSVTVTRFMNRRVRQVSRRNGKSVVRYVTRRVPYKVKVQPRARPGSACSTQFVNGARGTIDAADAVARTTTEGFAKGTVIFLDIERMESTPKAMRDYYRAWTEGVLKDGRYRPGYYAHKHNAETVYRDVKEVHAVRGVTADPPFWIASGRGFSEEAEPADVGHAFAKVWQGVLDVVETHNGVKLPIDINVSFFPSPSDQTKPAE